MTLSAYCLVRDQPWYRRDAFLAGLKRAGCNVAMHEPPHYTPDVVLVTWHRYGHNDTLANRVKQNGGRVIVAENGYIGTHGGTPKFDVYPQGPGAGHYYSLALDWHNGGGAWPVGDGSRFDALNIELKPWRDGNEIIVLPNRSFGAPHRMMPFDWGERAVQRIRKLTKRPVRMRGHPGNKRPQLALLDDIGTAHAAVVWYSTAGIHALAHGIPTFCEAPFWICKDAAASGTYDEPVCPERRPVFEQLAWAQWTIDEITTGEPFVRLLSC